MKKVSVFFHNYYGDHLRWMELLCAMQVPFDLYYNVVEDSLYNLNTGKPNLYVSLKEAGGSLLQDLHLRYSPNKGKDIGGKMVLLDSWMRGGLPDVPLLFLHDKRSPHKHNSVAWSDKLFQVADPAFASGVLDIFGSENNTGIVAAPGTLMRDGNKMPLLHTVAASVGLEKRENLFVAGTMFWCRPGPLRDFFRRNPPLAIRASLEKGNVLDEAGETITHCWERLLCGIITADGGSITELQKTSNN